MHIAQNTTVPSGCKDDIANLFEFLMEDQQTFCLLYTTRLKTMHDRAITDHFTHPSLCGLSSFGVQLCSESSVVKRTMYRNTSGTWMEGDVIDFSGERKDGTIQKVFPSFSQAPVIDQEV
jgi:hypothetical protein